MWSGLVQIDETPALSKERIFDTGHFIGAPTLPHLRNLAQLPRRISPTVNSIPSTKKAMQNISWLMSTTLPAAIALPKQSRKVAWPPEVNLIHWERPSRRKEITSSHVPTAGTRRGDARITAEVVHSKLSSTHSTIPAPLRREGVGR